MMRRFGLKAWLLVSALAVAGPAIMPAFANGGGGSTGSSSSSGSDTSIIKPEDNDATGWVGGGATPQGQTSGTTTGQDSTGAVKPGAQPPVLSPCPEGYARFDDYNRCSRP